MQELEGLSSREVQRLRLPVTQEGGLDALAVWFQLHLDEDNSLSTGPQEDTCWEQAIYPVHSTEGTTQQTLMGVLGRAIFHKSFTGCSQFSLSHYC